MTIDQQTQLARFQAAVELLGGPRSAARALDIGERHVTRLLAGGSPLHAGILADTGQALLAHAGACRMAERELSPAFAANRTPAQPERPKPRGRWAGQGEEQPHG